MKSNGLRLVFCSPIIRGHPFQCCVMSYVHIAIAAYKKLKINRDRIENNCADF